jgi:hypothetical protein
VISYLTTQKKLHSLKHLSIMSPPKRGAVEERLQEILLLTDNTKGVDKLHRQLADEGYIINKNRSEL